MTDASPRTRPEALFEKAKLDDSPTVVVTPEPGSRRNELARKVALRVLTHLRRDALLLTEGTEVMVLGPGDGLEAAITVHDDRAWWHLAIEGSIGLGRGYIENWWDSPNPELVVQIAARNMDSFDEIRNKLAAITTPVSDRVRRVLPTPNRDRNREDIGAHYDLGNDFFELFLDETMTYSAAFFETADMSLAEASIAKYDRLLRKLDITPGMTVTEIGTGWGAMALRAAETYGADVVSTTISSEQFDEAVVRRDQAIAGGRIDHDQVKLHKEDWRDIAKLSGRRSERLVSVEMIEAVDWRDYPAFFQALEANVAADGMIGMQAICVPDRRYERTKNTEDFIARFVFPGGFLPSVGTISKVISKHTRLQLLDVDDFGWHYAETLRRWRHNMDSQLDQVRAMGLDERFIRLWRFYLAYCEAAFTERHVTVNQLVLVGPDWRPGFPNVIS